MARVTVEDCVLKVPNRFDLVMMSAQRAREVSAARDLEDRLGLGPESGPLDERSAE